MSQSTAPLDDPHAELALRDAEQAELVFESFTREDAWTLGSRLRAAAVERGLPLVIGVTLGRQRLFHAALDGVTPDNDAWLDRKVAGVLHFHRSGLAVQALFRTQGRTFEADSRLDITTHAIHGGVMPIQVRGLGVVGTVGASGLPQREDHAFVVEQLRAFLAER